LYFECKILYVIPAVMSRIKCAAFFWSVGVPADAKSGRDDLAFGIEGPHGGLPGIIEVSRRQAVQKRTGFAKEETAVLRLRKR
jgi:hypothetical protein